MIHVLSPGRFSGVSCLVCAVIARRSPGKLVVQLLRRSSSQWRASDWCPRFGVVPSMVVLRLALWPSKQLAGMTCRLCKVIARRTRDGMDAKVPCAEAIWWRKGIVLRRILVKAQDCFGCHCEEARRSKAGRYLCFCCVLRRLRLAMTSPSMVDPGLALCLRL